MSESIGTLEWILQQLTAALEPILLEFQPNGSAQFAFRDIGIVLTEVQEVNLDATLQASISTVHALVQRSKELATAIEDEDVAAIVAKGLAVIAEISKTTTCLQNLANAVPSVPSVNAAQIAERLFNRLVVRYLAWFSGTNQILELLGILVQMPQNEGSEDPANPPHSIFEFDFSKLGSWIQSPSATLFELYKWGQQDFESQKLLRRVEKLLAVLGAPVFLDPVTGELDVVSLKIKSVPVSGASALSIGLQTDLSTGTTKIGNDEWSGELRLEAALPTAAELILRSDGSFTINTPSAISGRAELAFTADRSGAADPYIILGQPGKNRLAVRTFAIAAGVDLKWDIANQQASGDVFVGGSLKGGELVIALDQADGFLGKILSGAHIESEFAFDFELSSSGGLRFKGGGGLEIQLPLHQKLGPVEISALTLSVGVEGNKFPIGIGADIKAALGPLAAVVEGIGMTVDLELKNDRSGNAGPLDVSLGFRPPKGVGLSLDAGPVKGGGYLFFDFDNEEYAGALELSFLKLVTVKAIGLITTRMPDGSKGFSLLILVSAEFTPIQLGFGFTLNAVGGLLGLNRTVKLDLLREGVRTGAVNSIMFPTNVVENAPKIISDLRTIFPPEEGRFLIGPMVKFGWGTPSLITLSFGLIIEVFPVNIAILGVLKVVLPEEHAPLVLLQVNFVGTLDVEKKMLTFDASLFESRLLFITLEGDMAVRLKWGDDPAFLLSVGGFHPAFDPPPLALPALRRITYSILNESWGRIRLEAYYAVTSATVQFGSRAELFFGFSDFKVSGDIGYDVLFQFSPFYFNAQVSGSLCLEVFGIDVLSIRLKCSLEGPSPWRVKGTGSVSILFWDADVDIDETWGEKKDTSLPPIQVMPILLGELNKNDNWQALPPSSKTLHVTLRKLAPELFVLHPVGALAISQRAIPLGKKLDKIGSRKPSDVDRISITTAESQGVPFSLSPTLEQFAPAQFESMTDSEKLSRRSFEKMTGGAVLTGGSELQSGKMVKRKIEYEVTIIDKEPVHRPRLTLPRGTFGRLIRGAAVSRAKGSHRYHTQAQPFAEKSKVKPEGYTVAFANDNKPLNDDASFDSQAMAVDYMNQRIEQTPTFKGTLHVIRNDEVNVA